MLLDLSLAGTPISTSVHELQGYLEFLGLVPAALQPKWTNSTFVLHRNELLDKVMRSLIMRCVLVRGKTMFDVLFPFSSSFILFSFVFYLCVRRPSSTDTPRRKTLMDSRS